MSALFDPVLRAPLLGSMIMSFATSIVGVFLFLRRNALLGETLSHAAYPGVALGALLGSLLGAAQDLTFFILGGAFIAAWMGLLLFRSLMRNPTISSDSASCFVLAGFFGIGTLLASFLQVPFPTAFRTIPNYLYGQVATMTDRHILLYALLASTLLTFLILFFKEIHLLLFDPQLARSLKGSARWVERGLSFFVALAVIMSIRSVGVVLLSAMLIAPAAAARQYTDRLSLVFLLSALFGTLSALWGSLLALHLSARFSAPFPPGPLIVLLSSAWVLFSLLFAPKRGLVIRTSRILIFRLHCVEENLLKFLWRCNKAPLAEFVATFGLPAFVIRTLLMRLQWRGWICRDQESYQLTVSGRQRGNRIVRLHRLWEAYLVTSLGEQSEGVHRSAEEIEHILTPELEKELTELLNDPKEDPHAQPIPAKEGA